MSLSQRRTMYSLVAADHEMNEAKLETSMKRIFGLHLWILLSKFYDYINGAIINRPICYKTILKNYASTMR